MKCKFCDHEYGLLEGIERHLADCHHDARDELTKFKSRFTEQ